MAQNPYGPEIALAASDPADLLDNGWVEEAYARCQDAAKAGTPVDSAVVAKVEAAYRALTPEQSMGGHKPLVGMRDRQIFSGLHFSHDLTDHQKRVAFKSGVGFINIETSSQCNRVCDYCPNGMYDRRTFNSFFDKEAYERIVDDLASIDFHRRISLVGLNEPLLHMEDFTWRLRLLQQRLPKAYVLIFTNGDYLTREIFDHLVDCGVTDLRISIHLGRGKPYSERDMLQRIFSKANELGLTAELNEFAPDKSIGFAFKGSPIKVLMRQSNYMTQGNSRGEVMKGVGKQVEGRTIPCFLPYDNFIINYRGDVLPCCGTIGASEEIKPFIVGNVREQSIFDIYASKELTAWRRHTMRSGPLRHPCATCPEQWPGFPNDWERYVEQAVATAIPPMMGED